MKHTQKYANEFSFKLNEGNCEVGTIDRLVDMITASVDKRIKYKDLIK